MHINEQQTSGELRTRNTQYLNKQSTARSCINNLTTDEDIKELQELINKQKEK